MSLGLGLLLALGSVGSLRAQGVFFDTPGADRLLVQAERVGDRRVDLVFPDSTTSRPLAAIVFVLGFPDDATSLGPLMDYEQYRDWARIVAAEGFVAVLYSTIDPVADLWEVMEFVGSQGPRLGIDPDRVGLWSASANVPTALHYVRSAHPLRPRALAVYYGLMPTPDGFQAEALVAASSRNGFRLPAYAPDHAYPRDLPVLVVRAGGDTSTAFLSSIDHFVGYALSENLRVTVVNYPDGQHSFDSRDDTEETRRVIAETLGFLTRHLRR